MSAPTIEQLREQVRGPVISPDDDGYDEARTVYNAMVDRRPSAVVRAANAGDVVAAVDHARAAGVDVAIRGGGHSVPGFGTTDGGVVVDLSGHARGQGGPRRRTARAEGGATWGDFNAATGAFGLATTGGIISTTGVGGLTLGGGIGYLARGLGLSLDTLRSIDVVTADGRFLTASDREHEDLFWAMRGGGGNFGVATRSSSISRRSVRSTAGRCSSSCPMPATCCGGTASSSPTHPRSSVGSRRIQIAPPLPFIPEERHGDTFLAFVSCWTGPLEEGETMLKSLRDVAPVVAEHVGPMPYAALNCAFDALVPPGLQHYWKANFVSELTDEVIDAHLVHGPDVPVVNSTVHIYPINGAVHRVAPGCHRVRAP